MASRSAISPDFRMRFPASLACMLTIVLAVTACKEAPRPATSQPNANDSSSFVIPGAAEDFAKLPAILDAIRRASSLTLYEGLPHQSWEKASLESELATKETFRIREWPFYKRPLL